MKQANNVITYYWDKNGKPDGIRSALCQWLWGRKAYEIHDAWTIENAENEVCGAFYHITGAKWLVDFLSWLTNLTVHLGENRVKVITDDTTGEITSCEKLS